MQWSIHCSLFLDLALLLLTNSHKYLMTSKYISLLTDLQEKIDDAPRFVTKENGQHDIVWVNLLYSFWVSGKILISIVKTVFFISSSYLPTRVSSPVLFFFYFICLMKFLLDGNTLRLLLVSQQLWNEFCCGSARKIIPLKWYDTSLLKLYIHLQPTILLTVDLNKWPLDLAHWNCHQLGLKAVRTWVVFNWCSIDLESSVQLVGPHMTHSFITKYCS